MKTEFAKHLNSSESGRAWSILLFITTHASYHICKLKKIESNIYISYTKITK